MHCHWLFPALFVWAASSPINLSAQQAPDTVLTQKHADRYGDPLPAGALARLGTVRFRTGGRASQVTMGFLPGHSLLVASTLGGGVGVWDVTDGRLVREFSKDGYKIVASAVAPDGIHLATLAQQLDLETRVCDTRLLLWNAIEGGEAELKVGWPEPLTERSTCLAWTPDQLSVATGTRDGRVRVWDLASRQELLNQQVVRREVYALAFSPDGEWVAVAGRQSLALWQWLEGGEPEQLLTRQDRNRGARCVAFSPDGKLFATGSNQLNGIRVWDLANRKVQWRIENSAVQFNPGRVEFTSDSRLLVVPVGQRGQRVELRDASTGRVMKVLNAAGMDVQHVAVTADQHWLAACGSRQEVRAWRLPEGEPQHDRFVGHGQEVYLIKFTPDGKQVVTSAYDSTIHHWDAASGEPLGKIDHEARSVTDIDVSPDGKYLGATAFDLTSRVWELQSGRETYNFLGHARLGAFRANVVGFSPDGERFFSFGRDMYLRVWKVRNGMAVAEFDVRPPGAGFERKVNGELGSHTDAVFGRGPSVNRAQFTPDRRRLMIQLANRLSIFDTQTGEELRSQNGHFDVMDVTADGATCVTVEQTGASQSVISLRDFATFAQKQRIEAAGIVGDIRFSPTGDRLAYTVAELIEDNAWRTCVVVYEIATAAQFEIQAELRPIVIAFAPEGKRLAASYFDTTVVIWDLTHFARQTR